MRIPMTKFIKKNEVRNNWYIIDANNAIVGRLATIISKIIRGKNKTNFTPHADCGDYVIVINADKVVMSGDKMNTREIFSHTGFPGGQKKITPNEMLKKDGGENIIN